MKLCTKNGSAEQARLAVQTLAAMYKCELQSSTTTLGSCDSKQTKKEENVFVSILKSITSPSHMTLSVNGKDNHKIVTVLATLSTLVEVAPFLFVRYDKGRRGDAAIRFALDTVIMGHDDENSIDEREEGHGVTSKLDGSHQSPESTSTTKFNKNRSSEELSLSCRRLCAAIDFLVSHIRSTIKFKKTLFTSSPSVHSDPSAQTDNGGSPSPSKEHIASLFNMLITIISNCGQPPSLRDRISCKGMEEMAALRKCAALNVFRLCDRSLGLDDEFLTCHMWRILSSVFTDIDSDVRGKA